MIRDHSIKRETLMGALILAALALAALSILVKQARYDLSDYGLVSGEKSITAGQSGTRPGKDAEIDTDSLVPTGFGPLSGAERYDAGTLYEKINGKAPLYLSSGFRELVTRRFMHASRKDHWIEVFIYDMGSFNNAFTVYSQQKRADALERPDVPHYYTTENTGVLARGSFYVEIVGSAKGPLIMEAVEAVSRRLRDRLGPVKSIGVFDYLKSPFLVPGSEIYHQRDAFGMEGFAHVYSARFRMDGLETTVYMTGPRDKDGRDAVIKGYSDFLLAEGATVVKGGDIESMKIFDMGGYFETIFPAGDFGAGVHEAETREAAVKVSAILRETILKNSGVR